MASQDAFATALDNSIALLQACVGQVYLVSSAPDAAARAALLEGLAKSMDAIVQAEMFANASRPDAPGEAFLNHELQHKLLPACRADLQRVIDMQQAEAEPPPAAEERGGAAPAPAAENDDDAVARMDGCAVPQEVLAAASLADCVGVDEAKDLLYQAVVFPSKAPGWYDAHFSRPCSSVLLYGPPGTGKTQLAHAVGAAWFKEFPGKGAFFEVSGADLMSKWMGEGEKQIKALFMLAARRAPSVVFIDELDQLCGHRDAADGAGSKGLLTEMLVQTNAVLELPPARRVVLIAATNHPWAIDTALMRRFARRLHLPLPAEPVRAAIIARYLSAAPDRHTLSADDVASIAARTERFSGAEVVGLLRNSVNAAINAAMARAVDPARDGPPLLELSHVEEVLPTQRPVTTDANVQRYVEYSRFGR